MGITIVVAIQVFLLLEYNTIGVCDRLDWSPMRFSFFFFVVFSVGYISGINLFWILLIFVRQK